MPTQAVAAFYLSPIFQTTEPASIPAPAADRSSHSPGWKARDSAASDNESGIVAADELPNAPMVLAAIEAGRCSWSQTVSIMRALA